ncbi:MAG: membrane protein insertion efficiency factor YidD [Fimbriimonadales bacterium]|nr:membrane protein insertion efficiency factor YidD [Fimbriimonadales bacterium]
MRQSLIARLLIGAIRCYQRVSRLTPPTCRYYPTCSQYTLEAVQRFGVLQGLWLGLKRLLRCHPFAEGGYDPVPEALGRHGTPCATGISTGVAARTAELERGKNYGATRTD